MPDKWTCKECEADNYVCDCGKQKKKKKKKKSKTFKEQYEVRYNCQMECGLWSFSKLKDVFVDVEHGDNEKNNHDKAMKQFYKEHPDAQVQCVTYC